MLELSVRKNLILLFSYIGSKKNELNDNHIIGIIFGAVALIIIIALISLLILRKSNTRYQTKEGRASA